jgi:hypothetical protein
VGGAGLKARDPNEGVVVALDLEGARAVAEHLDLAGGVGLHPDGGIAGSGVAE